MVGILPRATGNGAPARLLARSAAVIFLLALAAPRARAQRDTTVGARNDSVTVRLLDADVRTAVQALAQYLDRPVVVGNVNPGAKVSVETPRPVPRADVARLLRSVLESQSMELLADSAGGVYRVQQKEPPRPQPVLAPSPARQPGGPLELFVIHLRHARAAEVSATVNALYGRAGALGELGEAPSTLSRQLQASQVPPGLPAAGAPAGAVTAVVGRNATLAGDVTIVPDERANSLLIRASRADFDLIEAAVQQIDVRPLQVLIEVLVAEVRKDRSLDFGVDASLPKQQVGPRETVPLPAPGNGSVTVIRGNSTVEASTSSGLGLGDFVMKLMGLGGVDVNATLRAAAERGDATILSRPVLLAANNEEAEINVGSQRPFVQVSRVLPTENTARDQVVQYRDVGTRLRILPTISADGYVKLQVTQEINAATAEQAFGAPVISTRSVETRLLIKDGQTIVLGGLTDQQKERRQGGVPFFSAIPWLGGLFGHFHRQVTETELFLFLTPRVIRTDEEAKEVTEPLRKRAAHE